MQGTTKLTMRIGDEDTEWRQTTAVTVGDIFRKTRNRAETSEGQRVLALRVNAIRDYPFGATCSHLAAFLTTYTLILKRCGAHCTSGSLLYLTPPISFIEGVRSVALRRPEGFNPVCLRLQSATDATTGDRVASTACLRWAGI